MRNAQGLYKINAQEASKTRNLCGFLQGLVAHAKGPGAGAVRVDRSEEGGDVGAAGPDGRLLLRALRRQRPGGHGGPVRPGTDFQEASVAR